MLVNIRILTVDIYLNGGAKGRGQTGFAFGLACIFLGEICVVLSAKRIESFCGAAKSLRCRLATNLAKQVRIFSQKATRRRHR